MTALSETGYYGFAFMLDKDWVFDNHMYTISQFITSFKDWDCGSYHRQSSPTTMTFINGSELFTRVRYGDICLAETYKVLKVGTVVPGQWHTFVLGARWEKDKKGFFQVWFDGKEVLNKNHLATTLNIDHRYFVMRYLN